MRRERGASGKQCTDREVEQLRTFLRKCFVGTYEFLQLSHGTLFIFMRGLSLRPAASLQFSISSTMWTVRGKQLRIFTALGFGCSLLVQPCASIPVCLQKELRNWKAWLLWLASSPWATLCFAVPRVTGSTHLVRSLALTWMHPIQHLTSQLFAPANKKPADLTFICLCSMYLTTKKAMSLAVWLTLAGSQDIAMLSMDHSATEAPLCCSKALQCTLTQVRKW